MSKVRQKNGTVKKYRRTEMHWHYSPRNIVVLKYYPVYEFLNTFFGKNRSSIGKDIIISNSYYREYDFFFITKYILVMNI